MSEPECTGPFSDARDCPVHRPPPHECDHAVLDALERWLTLEIDRYQTMVCEATTDLGETRVAGKRDMCKETLAKLASLREGT